MLKDSGNRNFYNQIYKFFPGKNAQIILKIIYDKNIPTIWQDFQGKGTEC